MEKITASKRLSVTLGPKTVELLRSGHCSAESGGVGARLETLAQRYLALVSAPLPQWTAEIWQAVILAASRIDLSHPAAPYSLAGMLKAEKGPHKAVYTLDQMTPLQGYAIVAFVETFLGSGRPVEVADIEAVLAEQEPLARV